MTTVLGMGMEVPWRELAGGAGVVLVLWLIKSYLEFASVPRIEVELTEKERKKGHLGGGEKYEGDGISERDGCIVCYDPATRDVIARKKICTKEEVEEKVRRCAKAQESWEKSSFKKRKMLLKILQKYILEHQEEICNVSAKDSGKPMLDAAFGEILTTCEKIRWLLAEGEQALKPEPRSAGSMMFYKSARVEYHPLGVIGAIVPWNYPFHNILNPVTAAVFAGCGIVVKVSEYASWSSEYYERIIHAALDAVGASRDLVQVVHGFGTTGQALVKAKDVSKLIFVGSTGIGRKVLEAAAENLTPVVLELGGKDPVIVCDDANLNQLVPITLRATFQSCGQNCTGAERILVQEGIYDKFLDKVVPTVENMRQGAPLDSLVDCGAMCMPKQASNVQALVDDAVLRGAKVLVGGKLKTSKSGGQYYPPTILVGVTKEMRIWNEEVFGPVMCVEKFSTDEEAVRLVNSNPFGLGSSIFSGSKARAKKIAIQLKTGASSINDFATTYLCQSLPFGGVKESGFDKFGGIEGLRGMCYTKAVCEDKFPLMNTTVPPELQYPVKAHSFKMVCGIVHFFYGLGIFSNLTGLVRLLKALIAPGKPPVSDKKQA
ncbi:aldehyde dehydrogenase [Chloropicon primus]|nr:aldehyde dehydrogenase [Chloropicon primus]